ncbi:MAG TPA: hypothetical protein VF469_30815, partial [Kofleriaceae bacterium]
MLGKINVLSEATKPSPDPRILAWLRTCEAEIVIDPVILGEIRFAILLLRREAHRDRLEQWFDSRPRCIARLRIWATVCDRSQARRSSASPAHVALGFYASMAAMRSFAWFILGAVGCGSVS